MNIRGNKLNLLMKVFIPIFIFITFFLYYKSHGLSLESRYYFDEYAWIGRSYYFELLLNGDFKNLMWKTRNTDGDPKLTTYLIGLFLYPDYLKEKKDKGEDYDMVRYLMNHNIYEQRFMNHSTRKIYDKYLNKKDYFWSPSFAEGKKLNFLVNDYGQSFKKTVQLIYRARVASITVTAISAIVVYILYIKIFRSVLLSLVLTSIYGFSSLVVTYGTIAYSEPLYLLLFYVSLLITLHIINQKKLNLLLLILLTIVLALLNQTKLNGVLLLMSTMFLIFIKHLIFDIRKAIMIFLVLLNIFGLVYIGTNPMLFDNPIKNIIKQYEWTHKISVQQQNDVNFKNHDLRNPYERFVFMNDYFSTAANRGIRPRFIANNSRVQLSVNLLIYLFFLGLLKTLIDIQRSKRITDISVITIIGVLLYTSLLLYLMLAWERYLIHMLFFIVFFIGQGIIYSIKISKSLFKFFYSKYIS